MKTLLTLLLAVLSAATFANAHDHHAGTPLDTALGDYVKIQTALAADSLKGVPEAATALAATARQNTGTLPEPLAAQAEAVGKAADLKAARAAFKTLSATLIATAAAATEKLGSYHEAFCPMAGASWIQAGKEIANPYFGLSMRNCGEIKR
jgi:hypothetical protein